MGVAYSDVSTNTQTGERYNRKIFSCSKDDSWVTVETPFAEAPVPQTVNK